ncbi:uncharacterized protein MELLADRAFT_67653 [Melampsora larici-populina 98AG31]|uniref:HCNGP-domain-containing protein n=1 Tax=Melampsora larici-populina (strain 98AG31 / pathotype 3-4-7) TaxID=747676 RepID=F4S3Y7_MELLP|nr:uncharacterized protein MELLADRAFT_67653 [Melampsora larici-populina 98AG31]EGG00613.1 hypothetical protein MELLADRAFT_67653 [Melampsora larici-populina 98AG31]
MEDGLVVYASSDGSDCEDGSVKKPSSTTLKSTVESQPHVKPLIQPSLETSENVSELRPTDGPASLSVKPVTEELPSTISPEADQDNNSKIDITLVSKLEKFKSLRDQGIYFNDNLVKNKSYRNPHIYTKLVQFVDVEETGSNFSPDIWDPLGFPTEAYADALREKQQKAADAKQLSKSQAKRTEIEFEAGSSAKKLARSSEIDNRKRNDYDRDRDRDRDRGQRDRDRDRGRDHDRQKDSKSAASRSPRWRK